MVAVTVREGEARMLILPVADVVAVDDRDREAAGVAVVVEDGLTSDPSNSKMTKPSPPHGVSSGVVVPCPHLLNPSADSVVR